MDKIQLWQSDGLGTDRDTLEEVVRTFRNDGVQGIESQQALESYIKKLPEASLREMFGIDTEATLQILADCLGALYAAEKYSRWQNEIYARRDRLPEGR